MFNGERIFQPGLDLLGLFDLLLPGPRGLQVDLSLEDETTGRRGQHLLPESQGLDFDVAQPGDVFNGQLLGHLEGAFSCCEGCDFLGLPEKSWPENISHFFPMDLMHPYRHHHST